MASPQHFHSFSFLQQFNLLIIFHFYIVLMFCSFFTPYLKTCRWYMFAQSQIYPKRHAFFVQFMLIFLQLLRDGALLARTCRRHGQTLNIFPHSSLSLSWFLWSASCPSRSFRDALKLFAGEIHSSQHRPPSLCNLAFRQHFKVFLPGSIYLCLYLSFL